MNTFVVNQFAPPLMLYSSVPEPVAFTVIVPVGVAQLGCTTVGAFTVGGWFTVTVTDAQVVVLHVPEYLT